MRTLFPLAAILVCLAFPAYSKADIFFFGDSLTDSGNLFNATFGTTPSAPYVDGRFSNGPTWAELYASSLGMSATASTSGGTNYAFGGATASQSTLIDLENQIDMFGADVLAGNHSIESTDKFVLWVGSNDIFDAADAASEGGDPNAVLSSAIANIADSIGELTAQGAENFIVLNSTPLGQTPFYQQFAGGAAAGALDLLSSTFNQGLETQLSALDSASEIEIMQIDMFTIFSEVQADPGSFGLSNATDAATPFSLETGLSIGDPLPGTENYLFWDGVHPTAVGHQVIANRVFALTAVPEPSSVAMLVAFGFATLIRRRRHSV